MNGIIDATSQPRGWICPICGRGVAPTQATCLCVPPGSITVTPPPGPYQPHPTRPGVPYPFAEVWLGNPPWGTSNITVRQPGNITLSYANHPPRKDNQS